MGDGVRAWKFSGTKAEPCMKCNQPKIVAIPKEGFGANDAVGAGVGDTVRAGIGVGVDGEVGAGA